MFPLYLEPQNRNNVSSGNRILFGNFGINGKHSVRCGQKSDSGTTAPAWCYQVPVYIRFGCHGLQGRRVR